MAYNFTYMAGIWDACTRSTSSASEPSTCTRGACPAHRRAVEGTQQTRPLERRALKRFWYITTSILDSGIRRASGRRDNREPRRDGVTAAFMLVGIWGLAYRLVRGQRLLSGQCWTAA